MLTPLDERCDSIMIGWCKFVMETSTIYVINSQRGILREENAQNILTHKDKFVDAGNLN